MTPIANQYGQALYSLALETGIDRTVLHQLEVLQQSFAQEPRYIRLLSAPGLTKQERCRILDEGFSGKLEPYLLNFLKILTEKGYIRHFSDCCDVYRALYDRDHGILRVIAVTALPLQAAQTQKLTRKLEKMTGKAIRLTNQLDPGTLGGIRLEYDGKRVDDTIRHRLDSMSRLLKETVI